MWAVVVVLSLLLQLVAAVFAARIIPLTRGRSRAPWVLLSAALLLGAARRSVVAWRTLFGPALPPPPGGATAELLGLIVVAMEAIALATLAPVISSLRRSREQLQASEARNTEALASANDALGREVIERRQAESELRSVVSHARCLLWNATIEAHPGWQEHGPWEDDPSLPSPLRWNIHVSDDRAAQEIVPLDLHDGETYAAQFWQCRPEDDKRQTRRTSAAALRAGARTYSQEFRCIDQHGREHWIFEDVYLQSLPPDPGTPNPRWQAVGVCTDVTERLAERRRTEDANAALVREQATRSETQASELRYRTLADAMPQIVFTARPDGQLDYLNRRYFDYTGLTEHQALGSGWRVALHPDDLPRTAARWTDALRRAEPVDDEHRIRRYDGAYRWHLARAQPARDADGNIVKWYGTATDIHDQKLAEERLARDAMLLANVQDSVIVTDLAGVVTYWNQGATRLFGWTAEEMVGRPMSHRFPESARAETQQWIRRIAAGEEFSGEWQDFRKDGSRIWIMAHTRPLRDATGRPIGIMGISHDVTQQKSAEFEMQRAKEAAEAASAAKDHFLAVLSHELRTPLTPVLARVTLMQRRDSLPDELRPAMEMIRRNIELEARLIDDLLDLTRIAAGKLQLRFESVDAHELLQSAIDIYRADADAKALKLTTDLAAQRHAVRGDPTRLQQVFWNLLSNAVKYTPRGGAITVRSTNHDGRLRVEVSDTGSGISADVMPRIFNAFEQGEITLSRRYGGLGLGLTISRTLMEMHGGTLTAYSAGKDRGSAFTVELDAVPATLPPAAPQHAPAASGPPHAAAARKLRILLVDDHTDTLKALARLLRSGGHDVVTAESVHAALEAARQHETGHNGFDLLLSDIGLPDGTGLDLLRQLPPDPRRKAIALSGFGSEEDLRRSTDAGFVTHLVKPINLEKLEAAIREVTEMECAPANG